MDLDAQPLREISAAATPHQRSATPGLFPLIAMSALSAVVSWLWLAREFEPGSSSAGANVSELARVVDSDITSALQTMDGPAGELAQFKGRASECPQPLAWVSIALSPGATAGKIRLKSGAYISPTFALTAAPARIAIPYPAPYETGQGVLTAFGDVGSAVIALEPAWKPAADKPVATREVRWLSTKACARSHG